VKNVEFGSGFAMIAMSNIKLANDVLKLSAADNADTVVSFVMFLPLWGRNPWFAKVFIMGQGPRSMAH